MHDDPHRNRFPIAPLVATAAAGVLAAQAVRTWRMAREIERRHPPIGRFVDIGLGRRLHYVTRGRGRRSVVLIHGASAQLQDMLASLVPTLEKDFTVVAVDRPGHGYSDRLPYHAWDTAQAHAIHAGVRRLGLERPVIVGHSMGGGIVMAYGHLYPDELSGVVHLGGLAFPQFEFNYLKFLPPAIPLAGNVLSYTLYQPVMRRLAWSLLEKFFSPQPIPQRLLELMPVEMLYRPKTIKANSEDQMMVLPSLADLQLLHYHRYRLPVVVMAGSADASVDPRRHAFPLAERLPDARLTVFEGIGHMMHHFRQDEIAAAIEDVFARREARRPARAPVGSRPDAQRFSADAA